MTPKQSTNRDQKKRLQIKQLLSKAPCQILDQTIYDLNDALTSILGICDTEAPKSIPKIKRYIFRVNQVLKSLKGYQHARHAQKGYFDIHIVLNNLLNVMEEQFRYQIDLERHLDVLNGVIKGSQSQFEEWIFYLLTEMLPKKEGKGHKIKIQLTQKNSEAFVIITQDHFKFPKEVSKAIEEKRKGWNTKIQIMPYNDGVEITLKLPLQFKKEDSSASPQWSYRLEVKPKKTARQKVAQ